MTAVIFLGPSLPLADARQILDAVYLPPARQSDILTAITRYKPDVIGLIDGEFGQSLSVWHKEILWALHRGIRVYGSSSMGALRAAETDVYGAIGVGRVYRMFATGELNDDDEVALAHGLPESNYRGLSEPLVNVRCTLQRARDEGTIDARTCDRLIAIGKALFFPERTFPRIFADAEAEGVAAETVERLRTFVRTRYVDVKRQDAVELLETIRDLPSPVPPPEVHFDFTGSHLFETLYNRDRRVTHGGLEAPLAAIANYAALHLPDFNATNFNALNRALVVMLAEILGVRASAADHDNEKKRFQTGRGLSDAALAQWIDDHDLTLDEFRRLIGELAVCRRLQRWLVTRRFFENTVRLVLDELRIDGRYEDVARQAAEQEALLEQEHPRFTDTTFNELEIETLVKDHLRATPCRMNTNYHIWAHEAGFHTIEDLRVELLRARLAREYRAEVVEHLVASLDTESVPS
jgi:hypothetical protein